MLTLLKNHSLKHRRSLFADVSESLIRRAFFPSRGDRITPTKLTKRYYFPITAATHFARNANPSMGNPRRKVFAVGPQGNASRLNANSDESSKLDTHGGCAKQNGSSFSTQKAVGFIVQGSKISA